MQYVWLRGFLLIALIGATVVLSACGSSAPPSSPAGAGAGASPAPAADSAPPAAAPQRGGTLRLHNTGSSFAGSDPALGQGSYNAWPIVAEYILRRSPEDFAIVPAAIEKWQFSPDGKELTLKVRQGVKFHNKPPANGREVEAKDIIYTMKTITGKLYPDLPSVRFPRRSELEQMTDAVAVDKYTVKVSLSEPAASFLDGLAEYRSTIVLPEGLREHFGAVESLTNPDVNRTISAGPFILTKFTDQVEAQYTRNPEYYEQGKPYLDMITQVWIPDRATANAAFVAGQLHYLPLNNPDERDLVLSQRKDTVVVNYAPSSCWYRMAFNLSRKPFDDARVRRALALLIDTKVMGETFFGEWEGKPLWRYPGPLPWTFPDALPQEELAKLPYHESPKSQKTVDEAKRLLAEAGVGNGFEFEILFNTGGGSVDYRGGASLITQQFQAHIPGIKTTLKGVDNAINQQLAAKGEFDTQFYCHIHDSTGVAMLKTAYHTKGGRNYPRFSDPKMDNLLESASRELDAAKRKQLLRDAQMYAYEQMPWIPITHYTAQVGLLPGVQGLRLGGGTDRQVFYKDAWLKQ